MFPWFGKKKRVHGFRGSGVRKLIIPETLYRRMINHCLEERPLEACGLLAGVGNQAVSGYATDNVHRSPVLYQVDEGQLLQVFRETEDEKQEVIVIYHSHIEKEAVPSRTDIAQATFPEAFYVIVTLAHRRPQVRAWRIVDGQVTEHPVVVQAGADGQWHDLRRAVKAAATDPGSGTDIP